MAGLQPSFPAFNPTTWTRCLPPLSLSFHPCRMGAHLHIGRLWACGVSIVTTDTNLQPLQEGGLGESACAAVRERMGYPKAQATNL